MTDNWYKMYEVAKNYYNKYQNLQIPAKYVTSDGIKIGAWISNQRRNYKNKKLSEEQIKLLNSVGMVWKVEKQTWEEMYELASNYYKHHKNLKINKKFITKNGYDYDENGLRLGIWIIEQRKSFKKNKISKERKEKLDEIKMIWDVNKNSWDKMYELASKYYAKNGNLKIPTHFKTKDGVSYDKNGYNLGLWIGNQRQIFNSSKDIRRRQQKLSPRRIFLLNDIGMIWDASLDCDRRWDRMYKLARNYYYRYKKLDIPVDFKTKNGYTYDKNGEKLGTWIQNQRRAYKARTNPRYAKDVEPLSEQKEIELEKIGMIWNIYDYKWYKNYEIVKNYYINHGNLDVPTTFKTKDGIQFDEEGLNIYNWLSQQRKAIKGSKNVRKLNKQQIDLLNEINMPWVSVNKSEEKWMRFYNLAKEYYQYHHNLDIEGKFITVNGYEYDEKGEKLGRWIRTQREKYKQRQKEDKKQITDEQINLLTQIGMIWQKIERKPKFSTIDTRKGKIEDNIEYQELVAKINLLKIMGLPLIIDGKPNPIIYMSDRELKSKLNINIEDLIYNFYSEEKSEEVAKAIRKQNKTLIKRYK